MKKIASLILTLAMLFSLAGCTMFVTYKPSMLDEGQGKNKTSSAVKSPAPEIVSSNAVPSYEGIYLAGGFVGYNSDEKFEFCETDIFGIDTEKIVVRIINDSSNITFGHGNEWLLEKAVENGWEQCPYTGDIEFQEDYTENVVSGEFSTFGVDLRPYSDYITEGKYRIVSPIIVPNNGKTTENFILYKEITFKKDGQSQYQVTSSSNASNLSNEQTQDYKPKIPLEKALDTAFKVAQENADKHELVIPDSAKANYQYEIYSKDSLNYYSIIFKNLEHKGTKNFFASIGIQVNADTGEVIRVLQMK